MQKRTKVVIGKTKVAAEKNRIFEFFKPVPGVASLSNPLSLLRELDSALSKKANVSNLLSPNEDTGFMMVNLPKDVVVVWHETLTASDCIRLSLALKQLATIKHAAANQDEANEGCEEKQPSNFDIFESIDSGAYDPKSPTPGEFSRPLKVEAYNLEVSNLKQKFLQDVLRYFELKNLHMYSDMLDVATQLAVTAGITKTTQLHEVQRATIVAFEKMLRATHTERKS